MCHMSNLLKTQDSLRKAAAKELLRTDLLHMTQKNESSRRRREKKATPNINTPANTNTTPDIFLIPLKDFSITPNSRRVHEAN